MAAGKRSTHLYIITIDDGGSEVISAIRQTKQAARSWARWCASRGRAAKIYAGEAGGLLVATFAAAEVTP